jgi:glucose-6-phosphate dehydrogenase assembly protein OpcA
VSDEKEPWEDAWSDQDTTPAKVEAALREMLATRHHESHAFVPARVLNLVVIADREYQGEIENRLQRVGRFHPSRLVLCSVSERRDTIDAHVQIGTSQFAGPGHIAVGRERIKLHIGPKHLGKLDTIVDPLVVTDLQTLVWSPHGHPEAVDALLHLAQVVLIDSVNEPDAFAAIRRAKELAQEAYVVDLAWLRSTPWRERVAATFDPPGWREELMRIDSVAVRHHPESRVAGVLFFGWLASRLGWGAGTLTAANGAARGRAHGHRDDVALILEPDKEQEVPGLACVEIGTSSGTSISLERGPGGLVARRRDKKGKEQSWTVLGASRGEGGILGEGIRQALLRDPAYASALDCGEALLR